ncbi:hypothetical protein A9Q84_13190 [Halobacteriovorax marinus]|uniref:Lipoprotein n=1 Tax=Halobacteriovorax marinus TaxID=97084 RepID=A0A1Y5F933_9BACT|nr:hypothetical protein A9Q84_13190 [Halobacteriovorax marinus]
MKSLFTLLIFTLSFSTLATSTYLLKCSDLDAYTDLGSAKIELETIIAVNGENDYTIDNGFFKFSIEDAWTDQDFLLEEVHNYSTYRPRSYKGHAKFANFAPAFFGMADLIIPHSALLEGKKNFTAHFILSWVEDHWGGTISTDCTMSLVN